MNNGAASWFYESVTDKNGTYDAPKYNSFDHYGASPSEKSFNQIFESVCEEFKTTAGIDVKKDFTSMVGDSSFMESYKEALTKPIFEKFREAYPGNDTHIERVIENVENLWDTKVRLFNESSSGLTSFLPMTTLEFPVLLKQYFSSILKDIMDIETTKTPSFAKHIRTTYWVDNQTGEEYEYPKCIWDGEWQQMYMATRGLPIRNDVVPLTDGRLYHYDIISNLTDGTVGVDKLSIEFRISAIKVGTEVIKLKGTGITVEFSTNGTFVNGDLDFVSPAGTTIADTISGRVDFQNGTVDVSSASGQVEGIVFEGWLSNENNLRSGSVREKRKFMTWKIEDGPRWTMPFTIEEIEDATALLDMNYYTRMVDAITDGQEKHELLYVIKFLEDEFKKYDGTTADIYNLDSVSRAYTVDINPPAGFAGDPFKYITSAIQFKLRSILTMIADEVKIEGLSFIVAGNPVATQLLNQFTDWKVSQGQSIGGIKVNNSYGIANKELGDATVRVVASNIYAPYTALPVTTGSNPTNKRELILHITAFPTDKEHVTFSHIKYTSHLFTSQSQTAYQSANAPGGAWNIITATNRYKTIAIQGIQVKLIILNSDKIYGPAPTNHNGAPWSNDNPIITG